ncbi:MAG: DUF4157 domain-containing protein [Dehalococcoidia bacterium]|nr:DUF4157 domain-containing protein [Dehalococcoidia bacterium]
MNRRTRAQRAAAAPAAAAPALRATSNMSLKAMRVEDVRILQSAAGNRAARTAAQRSMNVGAAGDAFEVEADAVAREVVNHTGEAAQREAAAEEEIQGKRVQRAEMEEEELQATHVQRAEMEEEELQATHVQRAEMEEEELQATHVQRAEMEEEELQARHVQREADEEELQMSPVQRDAAPEVGMEGGAASAETSAAIESARGGGSPLPGDVRREMEGAFGADFGGVRIHEGGQAADLNQRISARAFTTGSDIFIGQGGLNAGSRGGKELLAHELTHVVQQGAAPAARKTRRKA